MKKILCALFLALLVVPCFANAMNEVVYYDQGYTVGTFYKAVNAADITDPSVEVGKVYKVVAVDEKNIYITDFQDGELSTQ